MRAARMIRSTGTPLRLAPADRYVVTAARTAPAVLHTIAAGQCTAATPSTGPVRTAATTPNTTPPHIVAPATTANRLETSTPHPPEDLRPCAGWRVLRCHLTPVMPSGRRAV